VVDGLAAASVLPRDLPVFGSGDEVFDIGMDAGMFSVVVVADDGPGVVAGRCGDGLDAALAAVIEDDALTGDQVRGGCAGEHDVVAVAWPAITEGHHSPAGRVEDDLRVDAAPL